ncbi:enoyl-CoA hydratase-related protein [Plasmodium gonderi]|uniref:Enoyl-CoA hydratase-related protein n=1 Tax=Plasmodium gonderi TaxID=77519 RepID=A0A1Y1JIF1_PLAGO|nr:enoyl-CoA hydratase-related protein [Plasmodium gonderi]GAW79874.1 enoyl-CoA hydratase-related protein [Plasmodium gonderi]
MLYHKFKHLSNGKSDWHFQTYIKWFIHRSDRKLIRTTIFKDDDIYLDPLEIHNEERNKTNYLNSSDMEKGVFNRNNVGMNVILINNKYMDIKFINQLYKELREGEINFTKRFTFLTSLHNDVFNYGYNLYDLLKIIEVYQKTKNKKYAHVVKKIMHNINDLSYLIFSYRKPLISYCNGIIKGSAGFLPFLANNSASYFHSTFAYNNLKYSFLPYGGISYILSNLRGSIGFYLALTGKEIKSSDLIWCGLTKRWISEDCLELMELTSGSQLEVSEQDANFLLSEHFLKVPQIYTLKNYEEIIHDHFRYPTLLQIVSKLDATRKRTDGHKHIQLWAENTYQQICAQPSLAIHITFEIMNILRNFKMELLKKAQVTKNLYKEMIQNSYKITSTTREELSLSELKYAIDSELFVKALNLETNALVNFITCPDVLNGITSYLVKDTEQSFKCSYLNNTVFETKKDIIHYFLFYKNSYEYIINDRPDISFSSLAVLDKSNQHYSSHDRQFYAQERKRWSDNYLKEELDEINSLAI